LRIGHREATWRLAPTSRTSNYKTERAVKMKLISLVVLLVVYRNLQTDLEWPVPTPRYTWPNMAFHAYLPSMALKVKGMMTLTYDLDFLHKYLGPRSKIRHQVWTVSAHCNGVKKAQKMPKIGFWLKWRPKLLPVSVFTSDSHSTPSTLSKTSIISRGSNGYFSRYLGPKFENSKNI